MVTNGDNSNQNVGYIYVLSNFELFNANWFIVGHCPKYNQSAGPNSICPNEINQLFPIPFEVEVILEIENYINVEKILNEYLNGFRHYPILPNIQLFSMFNEQVGMTIIGSIFEMSRKERLEPIHNRITYPGILLNLRHELDKAILNIGENDSIYSAVYGSWVPVPDYYPYFPDDEKNEELDNLLRKLWEIRNFFKNTNEIIEDEYENRVTGSILRLWRDYLLKIYSLEDPDQD